MRLRWLWATIVILGLGVPALAAEEEPEVKLRNWHVGLQFVASQRNTLDVFDQEGLPAGPVDKKGVGGGFFFGRRFGERFLLDLQLNYATHDVAESEDELDTVEFLITGTVLFREHDTLQPFLRGGAGGGAQIMRLMPDGGTLLAFGGAVIAGGGMQVRLSDRFSLDLETVATFTNFIEVNNDAKDERWPEDWQVRVSNYGVRFGAGVMVWF